MLVRPPRERVPAQPQVKEVQRMELPPEREAVLRELLAELQELERL